MPILQPNEHQLALLWNDELARLAREEKDYRLLCFARAEDCRRRSTGLGLTLKLARREMLRLEEVAPVVSEDGPRFRSGQYGSLGLEPGFVVILTSGKVFLEIHIPAGTFAPVDFADIAAARKTLYDRARRLLDRIRECETDAERIRKLFYPEGQ